MANGSRQHNDGANFGLVRKFLDQVGTVEFFFEDALTVGGRHVGYGPVLDRAYRMTGKRSVEGRDVKTGAVSRHDVIGFPAVWVRA